MGHDNHILDGINKDAYRPLDGFITRADAKEYYLGLTKGFTPYNPDPVVVEHEGIRVVRDDLIVGTKTRAGDFLASRLNQQTFVYVQPRTGLAGVSLLDVAKHHNRKIVLWMPASKQISFHQACCIEGGATPYFKRIAAMPNLNAAARAWAGEQDDAVFIPLGLAHEYATAGIVHAASMIPEPEIVVVATSTGVLGRALQIAWPNAAFVQVAVARNLKAGEAGEVHRLISEPLDFNTPEKAENLPPFPCVETYDAKAWKYCKEIKTQHPDKDILFWNVGKNPTLNDESIYTSVNSYRDWNETDSPVEEDFEE